MKKLVLLFITIIISSCAFNGIDIYDSFPNEHRLHNLILAQIDSSNQNGFIKFTPIKVYTENKYQKENIENMIKKVGLEPFKFHFILTQNFYNYGYLDNSSKSKKKKLQKNTLIFLDIDFLKSLENFESNIDTLVIREIYNVKSINIEDLSPLN